ncbi:MAG: sigma-70 family RNA polymerase sigma factor [Ruminiclostridium sp.]|nr:sigma-70 family RNA polymerase sigma factor [Ruminiclostridium sp.]
MEDQEIIELYFSRDEAAIAQTRVRYEGYLRRIALNILANNEDAEECINDTYLNAWNSIPPNRPARLSAYLGAIVRNLAITVFRKRNSASHAGSQYALSLDELGECVSDGETPEEQFESGLVTKAINDYLRSLRPETRIIFICRYYYGDSVSDIAGYFGAGISKIKSSLFRTRQGLREHLEKEGIKV